MSGMNGSHPSSESLRAFLSGRAKGVCVEEHVLACAECCSRLDGLTASIDAFEERLRDAVSGGRTATAPALPESIGDYRIIREIGRGGMGVVYEAEQISLKRKVALKALSATAGQSERVRFAYEARAAARLHHTNIVPVFGVGEHEATLYLVMQCIDGLSLDKTYFRHAPQSSRVVDWGIQIASALAHAHSQHVLHRDIKPGNLLLDSDDNVWLTDFGLARVDDRPEMTRAGDVLGTLRYLAPEAFEGKYSKHSDQYALGLTLYELLAGRPAYSETDRSHLVKTIMSEAPAPLDQLVPGLARDLVTVVQKAIDRDPSRRYTDVSDLTADLVRVKNGEPIRARRVSMTERAIRWARRNPALATAFGIIALFLVGGLIAASITASHFRSTAQTMTKLAGEREEQRRRAEAEEAATRRTLYDTQAHNCSTAAEVNGDSSHISHFLNDWRGHKRLADLAGWEWYFLDGLKRQARLTLHGHPLDIMGAAWSPDGKRLATAGFDKSIRLWDTANGRQDTLFSAPYGVLSLDWSRDGQRLVGIVVGGTVGCWSTADGQQLWSKPATSIRAQWSPDGQQCAVGRGNDLVVLSAAEGIDQSRLVGHSAGVTSIAWHPDGKRVASGDERGTVRIWDVANGKQLAEQSRGRGIDNLRWNASGDILAIVNGDPAVTLADANLAVVRQLPESSKAVHAIDVSSAGLIAVIVDQEVNVWNINSGAMVAKLGGLDGPSQVLKFAPDGRSLVTATRGWNSSARIFDVAPTESVKKWTVGTWTEMLGAAWDDAGRRFYASNRQIIEMRDATGQLIWSAPGRAAGQAISPDGRSLVGADQANHLTLWDAETGKVTRRFDKPLEHEFQRAHWNHDGSAVMVFTCQHGGGPPRQVSVWDTSNEVCSAQYPAYGSAVAPDGRLAVGGYYTVSIIDSKFPQSPTIWKVPAQSTSFLAWSPDGKFLAVDSGQEVHIREVATGRLTAKLIGHRSAVVSLAWSPDGRRLLTGSTDATYRLWDAIAGQPVLTLHDHGGPIWAVSWSPDGRQLLTAGAGVVRTVTAHAMGTPMQSRLPSEGGWWVVDTDEFQPESDPFVDGSARWFGPTDPSNGYLELAAAPFVYLTRVHAAEARRVRIATPGLIVPKLWLNGAPITRDTLVALQPGWNTLAAKVENSPENEAYLARARAGIFLTIQDE
jgi:eukaryotic-like serine/threonine-protein kinase